MIQVTTVAQAVQAAERGADIIIAQGGESGGYAGEISTMALMLPFPCRWADGAWHGITSGVRIEANVLGWRRRRLPHSAS
jgi:hypothetical protein